MSLNHKSERFSREKIDFVAFEHISSLVWKWGFVGVICFVLVTLSSSNLIFIILHVLYYVVLKVDRSGYEA